MGYNKVIGFCRRCNREVYLCYASPCRLLHLILTVLSRGFWLAAWLLLEIRAYRACRCLRCRKRIGVRQYVNGTFSHPWTDDPAASGRNVFQANFNTVLIEKGLVFYASTRPIRTV